MLNLVLVDRRRVQALSGREDESHTVVCSEEVVSRDGSGWNSSQKWAEALVEILD